jgi:RNA polymerase sigma-70 factor, ECF subfamily
MERQEAEILLNSLFESWGGFLVRYAFQLTWSRETAEDLAQEAFMALYADLRKGKKIDNLKAWVLAIVRNLAHKAHRDRRRHGEVLESGDVMDGRCAPCLEADEWQDQDLRHMFSVLTPRETEVLMLRMQVFKYREIAAQLNISDKSVATLLARALRKLQLAAQKEADAGKADPKLEERRIVEQALQ